jgi:DNA replication protein DnaC
MSTAEWTDIERAEPVDEDLFVDEAPSCEDCGEPAPEKWGLTSRWQCRGCATKEVDACRERDRERSAREKAQQDASFADALAKMAKAGADLEASPHTCAGGCGSKMHRPDVFCSACDERRRAEEERRGRQRATLRAVPKGFQWASFEAPELVSRVRDAAALEKAKAAALKGAGRIVLTGPAGLGKTVLGVCILRVLADARGIIGGFVDGYELAVARAHAELGAEAPLVDSAMRAGVLVLDDIGTGKATTHDATADVIHRRHAEELPTVFTTGFSLEEIRTKFGDGIARRIFEGSTVIELKAGKGGR